MAVNQSNVATYWVGNLKFAFITIMILFTFIITAIIIYLLLIILISLLFH